jgi:hypothetical protein
MPDATFQFYVTGPRSLRTEHLVVDDAEAAIALVARRIADSRFTSARVHVDGAFLVEVTRDGRHLRRPDRERDPDSLAMAEAEATRHENP